MLTKIINFFRGVITVKISGTRCEQVLSILHRNNVNLYKMYRPDEQSVCFAIFEKHFEKLQKICADYRMDVDVLKMSSAKSVFGRYKKRWGIAAGLLLMIGMLAVFNCFIWDVQVSGCDEKMSEADVKLKFERLGIGVGSLRFGKDISALENQFLLENDEVIWVSVNMRFTTAYIELRERNGKQVEIYDFDSPCDIVAARDGQIVSMVVSSGVPLVEVGDSVCAGDKLVSREYIDRYGGTILVHSIAIIQAKTNRKIEVSVPLSEEVHTATGEQKSFFTLEVFNFKIPLYFEEKISYNNYDKTEGYSCLKLGRDFALPFSLSRVTYTEVKIETKEIDTTLAKASALSKLTALEKEQLSKVEILNKNITEQVVDGNLILTADYECVEDIAYTTKE